ncbi:MAG: hydrogenase formation protein HypD [Acidobacteriota bacterium]
MKTEELRNPEVIRGLLKKISEKTHILPRTPVRIMEVCGTHTMVIHKFGLRELLLQAGIEMLSGPGCPVCITPNEFHQAAISLVTNEANIILSTFGDMTRVPTPSGSIQTAIPHRNSKVRVVYSPFESLNSARNKPDKEFVFFGVGFETTIPGIAMTIKKAVQERINNFSVLSAFWLIPPPLRTIVESGETNIHGFLYPGHVSAIIGIKPYKFMASEFGLPGVITGFEPADVLLSILSLLELLKENRAEVVNGYSRVVCPEGNPQALSLMEEMLEVKDAAWRGLGLIPKSGLRLKKKYQDFDAEKKFQLKLQGDKNDLPGCRCGDVLRGVLSPPQCSLFGETCKPSSPYGPCMVSFEGACLAFYKYSHRNLLNQESRQGEE